MPDDKVRFRIRMPQSLWKKISYQAKKDGLTKSEEMELLIQKYIKEFEKEHGPIKRADIEGMKKKMDP